MTTVSKQVYQVAQIRDIEQRAQQRFALSSDVLMQRAGKKAAEGLLWRWPDAKRIAVFCGTGNNGGDGYVVAHLLQGRGLHVVIYQVGDPKKLNQAALRAFETCRAAGVTLQRYDHQVSLESIDVVVDAIVGIGLQGDVQGETLDAIEKINQSSVPVYALDIPSGIDANTGRVLGMAIRATATLTFIGLKLGLITGDGVAYTGELAVEDLQLPAELFAAVEHAADTLALAHFSYYLKPRPKNWHKGNAGRVLVVGGEVGYSGAAKMAAEAALRVGAGLVQVATRPECAAGMNIACPELMCHGVESKTDMKALFDKTDVVIVGPGLGRSAWGMMLWKLVLQSELPMVVDADGLNILAEAPHTSDHWVLTPHPGEAARLLGKSADAIQADRLAAVQELHKRYGGVTVLKGPGTFVLGHAIPWVCTAGNPGMATAGMGDILSGVIGGLMAQGIPKAIAAKLGVCLHATAGDIAAEHGQRGMMATDLLPVLRTLVNPQVITR